MSIKEAAYMLSKAVMLMQGRDELKNLIHDLNYSIEGKPDRSLYGYRARHLNSQLLGYLLIDQNREFLENGPHPERLPLIEKNEVALLSSFQTAFQNMNQALLASLELKDKRLIQDVLPPYIRFKGRYDLIIQEQPSITFEGDAFNLLQAEFQQHPSYSLLTEAQNYMADNSETQKILNSVLALEGTILSADEKVPEEISRVINLLAKDSQERGAFRFLTALMALRTSLSVLNQLVFQALLHNKLIVLNEDRILSFRGPSQDYIGMHLEIELVFDAYLMEASVNDLVLIHFEGQKYLGWILYEWFQMSEYGDTKRYYLRVLDDNLNPFGTLLNLI